MKTLRMVSLHEMTSLDPNTRLSDSSAATPVLKLLCPNLVRLDATMRIQPDVAESWTCSDDGLRYRFELRPGVRFHNGARLDARAVVWNFERIFAQTNHSPLAVDLNLVQAVDAIREDIVEVTLERPFPAFLYHLAGRCHLVADTAMQPAGAGPYRLTEWRRGSHLKLTRFQDYWDQTSSQADEIIVTWAPDADTRVRLIENGAFDVMESVPAKFAGDLQARGLVDISTSPSSSRFTLAFNCAEPPFNDVRLRHAVAAAIDCNKLVSKFMSSSGATAVTEATMGQADALALIKKLLIELGYPDGIDVRSVTTAVSPLPQIAAEVKAMLVPSGIRLDLRDYDDPPWWPHIYIDGRWQLAFQTMGTRSHPDALYRREFGTGGRFNATGYSNAKLDRVLEAAQCATNDDEMKAHYATVDDIIREDMPVKVLCETKTVVGARPSVENFQAHPLGYWNLQDVVVKG